jgi:iron complex outermembrane receptor protein
LKFPSVRLGQQVSTGATIWSHELRLSSESRIFNFLDYTVGAFHSLEPTTTTEVLPTPIALPSFLGGGLATVVNTNIFLNARTSEWSEFANVTAHIGRKTELTGGVRHINYDFITNLYLNSKLLLPVDKKSTPWVYSFSLSHRFSDDLLAYATTGSSWRGGPYQIGVFSAEQTPRIQQFTNLKDETSKSYEVGLKANFFDKKLRLNVAGFHQTFNNFIYYGPFVNYVNVTQTVTNGVVSEVATPGVFHFGSSVPAVINGVDLDLAYQITPRFNISAAFSYAKGHIKNGTVACNDLNGDGIPDVNPGNPTVAQIRAGAGGEDVAACRTNERLSRAPNWSLTVQSEASQPIAPDVDGFVRGLLSYYPKNPNDPDNPYDTVKAYGLLNMYLGIRSPGGAWEVSVFAKNIANTGRVLTRDDIPLSTAAQVLAPPTFRTTVGTNFPTSYVDVTYTQPREIGLNVRYAFGSR